MPGHKCYCLLCIIDGDNEGSESVVICQTFFVCAQTLLLFVTDQHFTYDAVCES